MAVVGAQLYTIRQHMQSFPQIAESLQKVASIGYTAVQLSAHGPVAAKDLAAAVADAGLTVAATHMPWERFLHDLEAVIEEHKLFGCRHAAIGGLSEAYYSLEGLKKFLDELPPVAEALAAEGMDFSYHNHNHELIRYDGQTWLARLYDQAAPKHLKAEIDTYWIQAGGGDPAAWVRRYAGREPLLHLKDMAVAPPREPRFAEIGEGNLNWPAILTAAREGGVQWYLVEQDECYGRDPFESLAISYRNLQAMGLS